MIKITVTSKNIEQGRKSSYRHPISLAVIDALGENSLCAVHVEELIIDQNKMHFHVTATEKIKHFCKEFSEDKKVEGFVFYLGYKDDSYFLTDEGNHDKS